MHLPAEWEKQKALLIAYPQKESDWGKYIDEIREFYDEFIDIVKRYQNIIILSNEKLDLKTSSSDFEQKVLKIKTNDTWIRDYGPISIKTSSSDFELLDFTFNGWGLKYSANYDNLVNRKVFKTKKIGFVLEGGSIDNNGDGVLLTTKNCLLEENRNPHMSKDEIEKFLKKIFNLKKIIWLENCYLEGDDTNSHIDMFARFITKDTIAYIRCDDKNDIHYEILKKMEEELKRTKFNLIPLPWVSEKYYKNERLPASYANFVIINGAVIVPTYNDKNDKEALKIFKKIFKDRDIIGIDASTLIREHGSIHCCCMNIF